MLAFIDKEVKETGISYFTACVGEREKEMHTDVKARREGKITLRMGR